jgi:hypothetical protein
MCVCLTSFFTLLLDDPFENFTDNDWQRVDASVRQNTGRLLDKLL